MNIKPITTHTGFSHGRAVGSAGNKGKECAKERYNSKQNNNDLINTTIRNNSDGRVSFKGGVPFLHSAANFASTNPLVAEAMFAILITCGLRPATIMAGAKNEDDKSKCSYQAAKSISSGLVGLAMTALVGTPIAAATKAAKDKGAFKMTPEMKETSTNIVKKGVDVLKEKSKEISEISGINLEKLTEGGTINLNLFKQTSAKNAETSFKKEIKEKFPEAAKTINKAIKEQHTLNNYEAAAKNVSDKLLQPVFLPVRAAITIALVPVLLNALGLKKTSSKQKEQEEQNPFKNISLNVMQNDIDVFKPFIGGDKS